MKTRCLGGPGALLPGGVVGGARAPAPLRVIAFGGLSSLPLRIAESRDLFAKHGLAVTIELTPNSTLLREGLAADKYDIAHAAVDNAVAMVESAGSDVVVVMGGDDSMNELFVQADIESVAALRGKTVIVDAPNTAYALQLKKILLAGGLQAGRDYTPHPLGGTAQRFKAMVDDKEYAASMLNPPFSFEAKRAGLRSLGRASDLLGRYQGGSVFVRRAWAVDHREPLVRYLAAYVEALRWFQAPANKAEAIGLTTRLLELPADIAAESYALAASGGLARDARLDVEGLQRVLALRAEIEGQWGGHPPAAARYFDNAYHDAALARLAGR